jgi:hypothetical protein
MCLVELRFRDLVEPRNSRQPNWGDGLIPTLITGSFFLRRFANQRRTRSRCPRYFAQEDERLRAGGGYLSAMAMHILQQAAALEVVAKELGDVHYNSPGCVVPHSCGPRKQNIFHDATGQAAGNLNPEFSSVVANMYAHHAATIRID